MAPASSTTASMQSSTSSPTPVNCTEAGFFPNPDDCTKFYRCVDWDGMGENFSVFHFDCPEGTIWDPSVDTCNHEDSVSPPRDCSGRGSATTTTESSSTESMTTSTESEAESTTSIVTGETSPATTTSNPTTDGTGMETTTERAAQETTTEAAGQQTTTEESQETTTQAGAETTTSAETTTAPGETTTGAAETTVASETTTSAQETTTAGQETTAAPSETTTAAQETTTGVSETTMAAAETTTAAQGTEATTQPETTAQPSQESTTQPGQETTEAGGEATTQPTDAGSSTDASTDASMETTTAGQPATTTPGSCPEGCQSNCPQVGEGQASFVCPTGFRRHPQDCNMFYQCTQKPNSMDYSIVMFSCPNATVYNEEGIQCSEPAAGDEQCQSSSMRFLRSALAPQVQPMQLRSTKPLCPAEGHFALDDQKCSSTFVRCLAGEGRSSDVLQPNMYRCPKGYVYWNVSRRCERVAKVPECQNTPMQERSEIPVEWINLGNRRRSLF
ncbi:conserved hypothetical protein [Culex quinquefasciatus]|uniref:Chitin-binding type-2 domain-containing protein n=1 Tax=Culex quinquefasciatus TaxID=7176 RepID=B0WKF5_CULQU|nr:conserved hypothetical protein [Culex quinquefasciatus]|eukprot:XP_001849189.1 conserved hypothetical protein [Culex quinquefasciatus]